VETEPGKYRRNTSSTGWLVPDDVAGRLGPVAKAELREPSSCL
jgi:hypothetical protein